MPTKKNISTPAQLYKYFQQYVKDCKKNPKQENFYSTKRDKQISITRERPLLWEGFDVWLRKNEILSRLSDYKANKEGRYSEYAYIIHTIEGEIWEDQYTGASVGIYQHNIIARKLGLVDKQDITSDGEKIKMDLSMLSKKELKELDTLTAKMTVVPKEEAA